MKYIRVCLVAIIATLLCAFLFVNYLNRMVLKNLSVEHNPIPKLSSDQLNLYSKVSEQFVNKVHRPNRAYIKEIYKSDAGEIIVRIEYFSENFSLVYVNGKIIKGYSIRDQPPLPCYYVFDTNGRFLRKGLTEKGD